MSHATEVRQVSHVPARGKKENAAFCGMRVLLRGFMDEDIAGVSWMRVLFPVWIMATWGPKGSAGDVGWRVAKDRR